MKRRTVLLVAVLVILLFGHQGVRAANDDAGIPTPADASLRPRPSPRPFDNPNAKPASLRGSRPLETPEQAGPPRLDDPVLQWLPEIMAASAATGTPPSLIAGVMRVESGGDPSIISPQGARGLMQVMPDELLALGIPPEQWHDPATNILAGAIILAQRSGGGWEAAAAYYFGVGCDYYGTCTYQYAVAVLSWALVYGPLIGDYTWYNFGMIPAVPSAPPAGNPPPASGSTPSRATSTPSVSPTSVPATPTETAPPPSPEPTGTPEPSPTDVPAPSPTDVPTEPPAETPPPDVTPAETPPPEASPVDNSV